MDDLFCNNVFFTYLDVHMLHFKYIQYVIYGSCGSDSQYGSSMSSIY